MDAYLLLSSLATPFAEYHGIKATTVSKRCAGQAHAIDRLRAGATITLGRYNRIVQWFSDHWPPDLPWPSDITRPTPALDSPAIKAAEEAAAAPPQITDPLTAVQTLLDRRRNEMMTDPVDWELAAELLAEAKDVGAALGPNGKTASPDALCLAHSAKRHSFDYVVRTYGVGGKKFRQVPRRLDARREETDAWKVWLALKQSGDVRLTPRDMAA